MKKVIRKASFLLRSDDRSPLMVARGISRMADRESVVRTLTRMFSLPDHGVLLGNT